jgi:hypothetical protein
MEGLWENLRSAPEPQGVMFVPVSAADIGTPAALLSMLEGVCCLPSRLGLKTALDQSARRRRASTI